jgi:hypothetical protein
MGKEASILSKRRILFIHAGGGKAGSSALQGALQEVRAELAGLGISYAKGTEVPSPYHITSGNGFALYEAMAAGRWQDGGASLLETYMGTHAIGICSSEFLGSMSEGNWRYLVATADTIGIDIRVVYFMRSAASYLVAAYNQDVKRAGEACSVIEFVRTAPWQNYLDLVTLDKVIDARFLHVLNYDRCRTDLVGAFVSAFEELRAAEGPLRRVSGRKVNRSLVPAELEVMLKLNQAFGDRHSQSLSDHLIYSDPELSGKTSLPPEVVEVIAEKYADAAGWMNQKFFTDPREQISVGLEAPCQDEHAGSRERVLEIAFDWALSTLAQPQDEGMELRFLRERLLAIDWANADHPEIPIDFDPIAYVLLNEDVLRACAGPFSHYVSSGRQEGRAYRWPMQLDPSAENTIAESIAELRTGHSTVVLGSSPTERLQHFYRTEAQLYGFAIREREYLNQIRYALEDRAWGNADFRQSFAKFREAFECKLNEMVRLQEEELTVHRETIRKYREASVWRFLKWRVRRSIRP